MKNDLLYRELGVSPDATQEEIHAAFRKRAKETHPDHGGTAAKFWQVETAYRVLSDPERRKCYDETGDPNGPEPDNSEAQALNVIANMVTTLIGADNFGGDYLASMRQALQGDMERSRQTIRELDRRVKRCEKLAGQFKTKRDSDPIKAAFTQQIDGAKNQIKGHEQVIATMDRALVILKDYSFDVEVVSDYVPRPYDGGIRMIQEAQQGRW